jgi:hypothetical protein
MLYVYVWPVRVCCAKCYGMYGAATYGMAWRNVQHEMTCGM